MHMMQLETYLKMERTGNLKKVTILIFSQKFEKIREKYKIKQKYFYFLNIGWIINNMTVGDELALHKLFQFFIAYLKNAKYSNYV